MIALLATLALSFATPQQTVVPEDPPVLTVNGSEISRSTYRTWLFERRAEFLLDTFVLYRRVLVLAEREGCLVNTAAIEARVEAEIQTRVDGAFNGDAARWIAELNNVGRSAEGRRRERRIDLKVDRNLHAIVESRFPLEEAQLRAEWQRLHGEDGKRQKARLLYRRYVQKAVAGETRDERRARRDREVEVLRGEVGAIRARAQGGEDFVGLIRQLSEDATTHAHDGLVASGLNLRGWSQEASTAVRALTDGQLSQPLFAKGGFWLVRSEGWAETSFDSVREDIATALMQRGPQAAKLGELRQELLAGARECVLPAFLRNGPDDEAVLGLDGRNITRSEFTAFVAHFRGEHFTKRFAESWVLEQLAAASGFVPQADTLNARVDEDIRLTIEINHKGNRDEWLAKVEAAGRTEASHRRELFLRERSSWMLERLMRLDREPQAPELRRLWERDFGPDGRRIHARWIKIELRLGEFPEGADEEALRKLVEDARAEAATRAAAVAQRLNDGEDFAALARELSDDKLTSSRGGDPGSEFDLEKWLLNPDALLGEVKRGRVAGPVEFEGSLYLFEFLQVTQTPFESARASILKRARTERPNELLLIEFQRETIGDPVVVRLPALAR